MKNYTIAFKCLMTIILSMGLVLPVGAWDAKTDIKSFLGGRWGAMSIALDGKIYLGGGYHGNNRNSNDWLEYDPIADTWTDKNPMPGSATNRSGGVTFMLNGKVYLGLGIENFNSFTAAWSFLTDLWEYDAVTDTWTQKSDFPGAGVGFCGVFVIADKAYIIGGITGKLGADATNKVYEYDPASDTWTEMADYPETYIKEPFSFSADGNGYISGGTNSAGRTDETYMYDATADTWTAKAAYSGGTVSGGVTFIANNVPYCGLGSSNSTDYPATFYTYNVSDDTWSYAGGFEFAQQGRKYSVASVIDNEVYMGAGWRIDGGPNTQAWFRDWYNLNAGTAVSVRGSNINNKTVKLYPNPAHEKIYISSMAEVRSYKLYSISGTILKEGIVGKNSYINIDQLSAGYYMVELRSDNEAYTSTIIVK